MEQERTGNMPEEKRREEIPEMGRKHGEHEHVQGDVCRECGLKGEPGEVPEEGEQRGRKGGQHVHEQGEVCEECGLTGEETAGMMGREEEMGRKGGEHVHHPGDVCAECGLTGQGTAGRKHGAFEERPEKLEHPDYDMDPGDPEA